MEGLIHKDRSKFDLFASQIIAWLKRQSEADSNNAICSYLTNTLVLVSLSNIQPTFYIYVIIHTFLYMPFSMCNLFYNCLLLYKGAVPTPKLAGESCPSDE